VNGSVKKVVQKCSVWGINTPDSNTNTLIGRYKMNIYTKNIAAFLKITIEEALKVQDQMERNGIDYSECTTRTFNKEARIAAEEIASAILTTEQMIEILENNKISECTPEQKAQVMAFAFGEDFMQSEDKGSVAFYG
jgi:DNA-directed RNA polymerase specialized sigma subunit